MSGAHQTVGNCTLTGSLVTGANLGSWSPTPVASRASAAPTPTFGFKLPPPPKYFDPPSTAPPLVSSAHLPLPPAYPAYAGGVLLPPSRSVKFTDCHRYQQSTPPARHNNFDIPTTTNRPGYRTHSAFCPAGQPAFEHFRDWQPAPRASQDSSVALAQVQADFCFTFAALDQEFRKQSFTLKRNLFAKVESALYKLVHLVQNPDSDISAVFNPL
jgi:hypothetical protein